jgi:hypothetical protein
MATLMVLIRTEEQVGSAVYEPLREMKNRFLRVKQVDRLV